MNHSKHNHLLHLSGAIVALAALGASGSWLTMWLWNSVLVPLTGFSTVGFLDAVGLLALGCTLSGAMLLIIFMVLAGLAHAIHPDHRSRRRELHDHWHAMTDEQRREFMESRFKRD